MASFALVKLINRKLLKISGPDCYSYLQGLICNDLRYLYEQDRIPKRKHARNSSNVLSAFMLNAQGRAICDLLLYRTPLTRNECKFSPPGQATEPDELFIECDSGLASGLANTLYGYRVRRKVELAIQDNLTVWSLFPNYLNAKPETVTEQGQFLDTNSLIPTEVVGDGLTIVIDPRVSSMGLRIISGQKEYNKVKQSIQSVVDASVIEASIKDYTLLRYLLGIGEGQTDHPESNCLPLECNADFLGSVSYDKGCYLGQELTARIHYTGIVRKRLMPLIVDIDSGSKEFGSLPLVSGSDIIDETTKQKVGILRNVVKNRGLALLRHEIALKSHQLIHEGSKTKLSTYAPFWWVLE